MAASPENESEYRRSIFTPPGRSGILTRLFFYWYNRAQERLFGPDDLTALIRAGSMTVGLMLLVVTLISFSPYDPFLVLADTGYEEPSVILAKDRHGGNVPIAEFYRLDRKVLRLDKNSARNLKIVRALIAMEDNNFYRHPGVDISGIARAMLVNFASGDIREGASTITQQVARLRFLSNERTFARKAREAVLALFVELRYSKDQIMELYLNEVPMGHGTLGVEAAAKFYFGKSTAELEWGEAAVIASLTSRPQEFSPLKDMNESRRKVRVVFRKLVETGELSRKEAEKEYRKLENDFYAELNRSPNDTAFNSRLNLHPYVTEYVKTMIPPELQARLYTGGLRIFTTIQDDHQTAAEEAMIPYLKSLTASRKRPPFRDFDVFDDELGGVYPLARVFFDVPEFKVKISREEKRFQRIFTSELRSEFSLLNLMAGDDNVASALDQHFTVGQGMVEDDLPVEGSLISMRPVTGEITAVVGGSGFSSSNQLLRFATARRQPGSAFKPLVYAAGLDYTGKNPGTDHPLTAATVLDDSPLQFVASDLSEYSPENYSDSYEGPVRLRRALTYSKNSVAVRVYEYLGADRIHPTVEKLLQMDLAKPKKSLPREATVALGTHEVTPLELTRAYAVFASEGKEVFPYIIERIEDSKGKVLWESAPHRAAKVPRQVITPEAAHLITLLLADVIHQGTGTAAHVAGHAAAGKTGTTNRYTDAWFVGYTAELVTAVQVGYDVFRTMGRGATGGGIAAPVWSRYMSRALSKEPPHGFQGAAGLVGVEICELTGKLPGDRCTDKMVEYFLPGTVPTQKCKEHRKKKGLESEPEHHPEDVFGDRL